MEDYRVRFRNECHELIERYNNLRRMIIKHKGGTLDFKPTCPIELLERQRDAMAEYIEILEVRAEIEGIEI